MTKNEISDIFIVHIFKELYDGYVIPKNLQEYSRDQRIIDEMRHHLDKNDEEHNLLLIFWSTVIWLNDNGYIHSDAPSNPKISLHTISDKGLAALNGQLPKSLGGKTSSERFRDWLLGAVSQATKAEMIEAGRELVTNAWSG